MDEAHQAALIEPSLAKIRHKLGALAPSNQTTSKQNMFGPNKLEQWQRSIPFRTEVING